MGLLPAIRFLGKLAREKEAGAIAPEVAKRAAIIWRVDVHFGLETRQMLFIRSEMYPCR
jgi:hypothetical protein